MDSPPTVNSVIAHMSFLEEGESLKRTDLLYRSATQLGVPFHVGSLVPATQRPWDAGDREEWLLHELPSG